LRYRDLPVGDETSEKIIRWIDEPKACQPAREELRQRKVTS